MAPRENFAASRFQPSGATCSSKLRRKPSFPAVKSSGTLLNFQSLTDAHRGQYLIGSWALSLHNPHSHSRGKRELGTFRRGGIYGHVFSQGQFFSSGYFRFLWGSFLACSESIVGGHRA